MGRNPLQYHIFGGDSSHDPKRKEQGAPQVLLPLASTAKGGELSQENFVGPWKLDTVHNVECLAALKAIPDDSLDVAVTSPPYWGQRGSDGVGSEVDPREYVRNLAVILSEVMRCLKPSGTLWLNIGDAYNTPINWREDDHEYSSLGKEGNGLPPTNSAYTKNRGRRRAFIEQGIGWLQYGNLLAIPYRIVLAMTDAGFLFRGEIIWEKSRPLPEGICRRPHRRHEGIYIFAKTRSTLSVSSHQSVQFGGCCRHLTSCRTAQHFRLTYLSSALRLPAWSALEVWFVTHLWEAARRGRRH